MERIQWKKDTAILALLNFLEHKRVAGKTTITEIVFNLHRHPQRENQNLGESNARVLLAAQN